MDMRKVCGYPSSATAQGSIYCTPSSPTYVCIAEFLAVASGSCLNVAAGVGRFRWFAPIRALLAAHLLHSAAQNHTQ
eukprot:15441171-Alexandrium_andersonii.AAC.1